ncbi:MAG: hypothetical protein ACTSPY_16835 [Candidatus Helarchaeota archaeon]
MKSESLKYNKLILFTILFYAVYGVLLLIVGRIHITLTFYVPISEGQGFPQLFLAQIDLASLFELIANTPIVILFFYLIYNEIKKLQTDKTIKYESLLKFSVYLLIGITIMGIGVHFTANLFNTIKEQPIVPPDPKDVLIYWLDELVGHHLIHFGIFGFFLIMMIFEWNKKQEPMAPAEFKGYPIWAIIIGLGFGIALAEGQASLTFLIIYTITTLLILILKKFRFPMSFKEKRLIWFNFAFYIGNILSIIIYGIVSVALGYAFFSQPHLLF